MKFARILIFSDVLENAEKRCNFSKFLDFNLIFIMIIPEIYLIFDWIFDLIFNLIFTEPPPRSLAERCGARRGLREVLREAQRRPGGCLSARGRQRPLLRSDESYE